MDGRFHPLQHRVWTVARYVGHAKARADLQVIVLEVAPDEECQRECLDVMCRFWKTKLEDRYSASCQALLMLL